MDSTFFFTNCDVLLDADFGDIYAYHKRQGNLITMVCAFKHYTVPYGVVELGADGGIAAMQEKPELNFLTNTGVYVVEPQRGGGDEGRREDRLPRCDRATTAPPGRRSASTPSVRAAWMDMGQMEELEKMRRKLEEQT